MQTFEMNECLRIVDGRECDGRCTRGIYWGEDGIARECETCLKCGRIYIWSHIDGQIWDIIDPPKSTRTERSENA